MPAESPARQQDGAAAALPARIEVCECAWPLPSACLKPSISVVRIEDQAPNGRGGILRDTRGVVVKWDGTGTFADVLVGHDPSPTLFIAPSRISVDGRSAGLGLFAARPLRRGFRLVYEGAVMSKELFYDVFVEVFPGSNDRSLEALIDGKTCIICAHRFRDSVASYINHAYAPHANSRFLRSGVVEVTKPVPAGAELYCSYGSAYWRSRGLVPAAPPSPSTADSRGSAPTFCSRRQLTLC